MLDFSRKEVVDHIFDQICKVLDQGKIEYVKWDMNRSLMDVFSRGTKDQGRVMYDYVIGLYDFLERIVTRYPDLLIEGCSGGGGRFDAGMMYYTPQIWCSDNTDAIGQITDPVWYIVWLSGIRSRFTCISSTESSDRKNDIFHTRGVVAMAGTFGYELNLGKLSEEEKEEIRSQVEEYRKFAPLIQTGLYYRLSDPSKEEYAAWAFVSEDQKEVLLNVVMQEIHGNMTVNYVNLQGLKCSAVYRDTETGKTYNGAALMEAGIPMPVEMGEFKAYQMHLVGEE